VHEEPETYQFDNLLDVKSIRPTQPHYYEVPLSKPDKRRLRKRHILPYGVIIENGTESLFNRNHVHIASRKAISEKSGVFFDDGCPPWGQLVENKDSRLRCEAVLMAWVLEKPLDHYLCEL
tara:strand:+ start:1966 stop:2328 length:363 start_codon:yes stop_codon:yes gene_type:complete